MHHTVNANDYTEAQVPGIIRSIYAYHVQSRGWSDIGYNFLVDRFGRIWEGRYGGVDKPVVGAHTLGYNEYSFAMSAIGNFDVVQPPEAMLQAYGALFAWKLALHGVDPPRRPSRSAARRSRRSTATATPARPPARAATSTPSSRPSGRTPPRAARRAPHRPRRLRRRSRSATRPQSNLVGAAYPDLVVRRAGDGRGLILPTGGLTAFAKATTVVDQGWRTSSDVLVTPDVTGDGVGRPGLRQREGRAPDRPGKGNGKFEADLQGHHGAPGATP